MHEELVKEYVWLVHKVVNHIDHQKCDTEDLISEGMIGLIKAVEGYDKARSIKFATYAAKCIENELNDYYRKAPKGELLVDFEKSDCTEAEMSAAQIDRCEEYVFLYEALKTLKKKDQMLMDLKYGLTGNARSQQEIAEMLGVSQSKISREEKRILNTLRRLLK